MKFNSYSKYLICSFIIAACCLQQCSWGQSTTVRPYKFGFTIDEQQHRREMRDDRGIVMGEFGFITADGIYHVTVYATDEQGRFRILAMKNYPYESPPKTVEVMIQAKAAPTTTTPKPLARQNFYIEACSGCSLGKGSNKPKRPNGIEESTPKSYIRPLSKDLSSPSGSSSANPKLPKTPSTVPKSVDTKLSNPATVNKQYAPQSTQTAPATTQTAPTTKVLKKQHTAGNTISKDFNQKILKTTKQGNSDAFPKTEKQGSSDDLTTANTPSGNPPPIMDIIMQEILPTVLGRKGQTATTNTAKSTTINNKAKAVPSAQKPTSTNAGVGVSKKFAGSSASSSANDNGDLYRFKYTLDYHGHTEAGKRNGNKEGSYFAIGDDNVERTIEYVANELGYQPRIRWRKLNSNEIKRKENTLKDYEFVWFQK